ncbi:DUF2795 domain-containing protein [Streptomyces sp. JJ36]|uniref:DUF2795 domain-containing protein n=1 Tax=Streptomyces sp. JJ36 TaxID=2736645 RepID=UPI001F388E1B|nr:DUF2795 domain-containing protein [Streptomyces sp. JJ36]MCF6522855.1 DUF2795 domain-containing protein [Streptomyces sp. JJ36]
MQRGSDRLNVHRDDEMKRELQGRLRSGHPTRAEEWNDPEPEADDDPRVTTGPVPGRPLGDPEETEAEALRFDLARYLGRGTFPAGRRTVLYTLRERNAPDALVDTARELPEGREYRTVQEVVDALGRHPRS